MRKFLILSIIGLLSLVPTSVMAISPTVIPASGYTAAVLLEDKDPATWEIVGLGTGKTAVLSYIPSGVTFSYKLEASGLEVSTAYSLIYFANPYPGNNPGMLIGTGTSGTGGTLVITGTPNLNKNLPTVPDSNMVVDHSVPPDNYSNAHGAKIWLVPSACYDSILYKVITWSPTRFLFETDLITYTDTDLGGGTSVAATTTITEPVATIGMTVSPTALAFGSVAIGADSTEQAIILTNTGNVPIKVSVTPSTGFYTDCLQLKPSGGVYSTAVGWVSPTITVGGALTVYAKVHPTIAYSGTVTGSLSFMANFAP